MKKLFALFAMLTIALCGCTQSPSEVPNTLTEIPDNASLIQSCTQSINNGFGLITDADFIIDEEFTGYLVLDVKYSSGSSKGMELVMVSPEEKVLIEIPNSELSAIYISEICNFPSGSQFQLSFNSVSKYEATYDIYSVSTIGEQE